LLASSQTPNGAEAPNNFIMPEPIKKHTKKTMKKGMAIQAEFGPAFWYGFDDLRAVSSGPREVPMPAIPIKCKGAETLGLDELTEFQGELKVLTDENYERLKNEILELGFSEPICVWKDSKKKKNYILNGHQRFRTVTKMVGEGYTLKGVPVSVVMADSFKQAKQKVLALTSQYGTMTKDGLYEFMKGAQMAPEELDRFSFPDIDIPEFKMEFFETHAPEVPEEGKPTSVSFDAYKNAAVKQVVLYYAREDYEKVLLALDAKMDKWKLEDYSQVIWRLLSEAD